MGNELDKVPVFFCKFPADGQIRLVKSPGAGQIFQPLLPFSLEIIT